MADKHFYAFDEIEYQRKQLLESKASINMIEMGAGSRKFGEKVRKVADIASSSLSSSWQCQIMFKMIEYLSPKSIIEIGSSLGISTAYIARANGRAKVYSLEGNPDSLNIARNVARNVKVENLNLVPGNFDDSLALTLDKLDVLDFAFVDGNHRKTPTLEYFKLIKTKLSKSGAIVFDDIYWSQEMIEAWTEIKKDKDVKASLDFFYFGIVFLDPKFKEDKHLKVLDKKFKPWQKFI